MNGFKLEAFFGLCLFALAVAVVIIKIWVVASLITSGLKASTNNCNETYVIESFANGTWFCPSK
jgi:hypothetical protein